MRKEKRAELDLVVSKVSKDPKVTLATVAPRVLVAVVPPVHKALKESKGPRVAEVKQVQEPEVRLAPWVQEVNVVKWESKAKRAILVHLDHKEQVVAMV